MSTTIYTQQINTMVEQMPITEQRFIAELIKKISVGFSADTNAPLNKPVPLKQAIRKFIDGINAVTDEPLDEEFDEIVMDRINITRELDL